MAERVYYDIAIKQLATAAHIEMRDNRVELRGCVMAYPQADADLRVAYDADEAVTMSVTDNGEDGDGLCLMFHPFTRVEKREPNYLFYVDLTPGQAEALAEALLAVVKLRKVERKDREIR